MASCQTSRWVSTAPYVRLTVTENASKSDGEYAVLDWKLEYISDYAASAGSRSYTVTVGDGSKSGTFSINGLTGTHTIDSGTKKISKNSTVQSISFGVSFAFNLTWSGSYAGTLSASGNISVAKRASYTVSYNVNGGSYIPQSTQTVWAGATFTILDKWPTRTGYTFKGWATSATSTNPTYYCSGTYKATSSLTLYAVWQINSYTITYNTNGGSTPTWTESKNYGVRNLSSTKPVRTNYIFLGWSISASASSATYAAGAEYNLTGNVVLYAVWQLAYTKPRIKQFSVTRCDSDRNETDEGTYALVRFDWVCNTSVTDISITWTSASSGSGSDSVTASGTGGHVEHLIGGSLSTETTYTVSVIVKDTDSTRKSLTLNGSLFPIDVFAGGKGVAIGKPAEKENLFEVNFEAQFNNGINHTNRVVTLLGKTKVNDNANIEIPLNDSLDNYQLIEVVYTVNDWEHYKQSVKMRVGFNEGWIVSTGYQNILPAYTGDYIIFYFLNNNTIKLNTCNNANASIIGIYGWRW